MSPRRAMRLLCATALGLAAGASAANCAKEGFQYPDLFGAEFNSITVNKATGFNLTVGTPEGKLIPKAGLTFCNVTIRYHHPGQNDSTTVQIWLPEPEAWNSRFAGVGGGGFAAGKFNGEPLASTVNLGYAGN